MWHGGEWSGARIHFIALLPDAAKQGDPIEGISVAGFQHPAASAGQLHTGIITATVIEMNPAKELMIEPAVTGLTLLPFYFLQSQHFRQINPIMYF